MDKQVFFDKIGEKLDQKKGSILIHQGETHRSLYLVKSGLLKAYYTTQEGKERIKSFIQPGDFIGSLISYKTGEPSTFSLACLTGSQLVRVSFQTLFEQTHAKQEISNFLIETLMNLSVKKEKREYELLCLNATERYKRLITEQPTLIKQITQNDIARYLGITAVALSRLKREFDNTH